MIGNEWSVFYDSCVLGQRIYPQSFIQLMTSDWRVIVVSSLFLKKQDFTKQKIMIEDAEVFFLNYSRFKGCRLFSTNKYLHLDVIILNYSR